MRCDDTDSSFVVVIQGGPRLDIMTQEGANQFLELFSSLGPFSTRIKSDVKPARKGIVSASSRQEIAHHGGILERSYIMFDSLANTASRHVFDSNVSTSDMRASVKHFQRVLENLTTAPQWTKTGVCASMIWKSL
ncbi:expressed unknown protein [Seminavis robusta]|uniref:Uncharacterized protein n=1 Tax=Seminavis robusta TaxID=568900 RepID=A0A9N8ECY3_9STRA|nr:expressed unknown protein [Seminavis robusta]|eukprot:Sro763_g198840.1 n/a (135) ;mRNA; r:16137-16541